MFEQNGNQAKQGNLKIHGDHQRIYLAFWRFSVVRGNHSHTYYLFLIFVIGSSFPYFPINEAGEY